jgi:biopolymer transport protein ExbB/TolQ
VLYSTRIAREIVSVFWALKQSVTYTEILTQSTSPVTGLEEELKEYETKHAALKEEIVLNEQTLETQKNLLSQLNTSVSDRRMSSSKQNTSTRKHTAEELIAAEEAEIRRLEQDLERMARSVSFTAP